MGDSATLAVEHFDRTAETYDDRIGHGIPGYATLHDVAEVLLAADVGPSGEVLIVGAGTGYETRRYAHRHDGWRLTAIEPSAEMSAIALDHAEHVPDRIAWHTGTLDTLPEGDLQSDLYDGATLLLVLHFLPDDGTKRDLLRAIAQRLKPDAPLLIADLFDTHADDWTRWAAYLRMNGAPDEAIARGMRMSQSLLHRITEDRLAVLLHETGFGKPERCYQALHVGGWLCHRLSD
ncbi:MAG: class I SAM-dependent methyltransferase [Bacteroidota bacterium]